MNKTGITYQSLLKREFESRSRRNPSYSLRAFARDLGVQVSKLSEAFRNRGGFSKDAATQMAERLRLSEQETELFVALVESEHGRGKSARQEANERLRNILAVQSFSPIDLEKFKAISDWIHFAILELSEISGFESDPHWIASRLGRKTAEVETALERLLNLGLLTRDKKGRLSQTHRDLSTPSGIPSREIREHHAQILDRAQQALEETSVQERDFSTMTLAIDSARFQEAQAWIREFRRKFTHDLQTETFKDRVYCLAIQFFPLDQKQPGGNERIENKKGRTK